MVQDISSKIKSTSNVVRHYSQSSSFQMALLFTVLCGAAVLVLGYFSYYFNRGHFIDGTEAVLDAEIKYVSLLSEEEIAALPTDDHRLYVLFNKDERPDILSPDIGILSEGMITFTYNKKQYVAKIHTVNGNRKLLVAQDITEPSKDYEFMQFLSIISILLVTFVIVFSYFLSIFVVRGTNKIAMNAEEIMRTGDLSRRLEVSSRWDDLGYMTVVLNALLDRVEELMQGVRQVSDNIAHDLRTPLTRMRNIIEDMSKRHKDPCFETLLMEADHLLATFNALLRISRIEAEKQRSQFTPLELDDLLEDVIAYYEPLAEDKKISIHYNLESTTLHGDRDLLFQAFANIIDNAIKYTAENGEITVRLSTMNGFKLVEISDNGAGIEAGEEQKIFGRFFRSDKCRSSTGTGLGLSLVAAVVDLHNGDIQAENNEPGLKITVTL